MIHEQRKKIYHFVLINRFLQKSCSGYDTCDEQIICNNLSLNKSKKTCGQKATEVKKNGLRILNFRGN